MSGNLDDLRRAATEEEVVPAGFETYLTGEVHSDKLFGMTAAERMFISIGCFLLTCLGGFFVLLMLEKIAL
ncbi:MAG: hypothetical protein HY866_23385 [Chloroflexi bacterium]|nr:hypothetical protein [Chloroflexota bacterium]